LANNIIKDKSFDFAAKIIELFQYLQNERQEFVLSKQILRSGTSIGALVRESEHAESKIDFVHKLAIAQKECNETLYWLELLERGNYITNSDFKDMNNDGVEIMKIITSIIKTTKLNISNS
jgi:four helix bundle protein